jgi:hypothetical protein
VDAPLVAGLFEVVVVSLGLDVVAAVTVNFSLDLILVDASPACLVQTVEDGTNPKATL